MKTSTSPVTTQRKKIEIDLNTYGDSAAEITIAKILNQKQNKGLTSYVTKTLSDFNEHLKALAELDQKNRSFAYMVLRGYVQNCLKFSKTLQQNPEIESYMINSMTKRLRHYLKPTLSKRSGQKKI